MLKYGHLQISRYPVAPPPPWPDGGVALSSLNPFNQMFGLAGSALKLGLGGAAFRESQKPKRYSHASRLDEVDLECFGKRNVGAAAI